MTDSDNEYYGSGSTAGVSWDWALSSGDDSQSGVAQPGVNGVPDDPNAGNLVIDVNMNNSWYPPPDFTGADDNFTVPPDGNSDSNAQLHAPTIATFRIDTSTMYAAEVHILNVCSQQISDFEDLRYEAVSKETWMFATDKEGDTAKSDNDDVIQIIQGQNALLQATGNLIKMVGDYVGAINNAGQTYARADRESWPKLAD